MTSNSNPERKTAQRQYNNQHLQMQVTFSELCEKRHADNDEWQRKTMDKAQSG